MEPAAKTRIKAYGLDRSVASWVLCPETADDIGQCFEFAQARQLSICPVGARNSFGDVFLLGEHVSLDLTRLDRIVRFDPEAGIITVESGVRDVDVLALVMPFGWQLASISGSPTNTQRSTATSPRRARTCA